MSRQRRDLATRSGSTFWYSIRRPPRRSSPSLVSRYVEVPVLPVARCWAWGKRTEVEEQGEGPDDQDEDRTGARIGRDDTGAGPARGRPAYADRVRRAPGITADARQARDG